MFNIDLLNAVIQAQDDTRKRRIAVILDWGVLVLASISMLSLFAYSGPDGFFGEGNFGDPQFLTLFWGTIATLVFGVAFLFLEKTKISANILAGRFGTEVALILEAGARRDLPAVAVSDSLEGQAVAYAFASEILIGEEMFAAGTYLSDSSAQRGATITIDVLRWLLVAVLFGGLIIALLNGA